MHKRSLNTKLRRLKQNTSRSWSPTRTRKNRLLLLQNLHKSKRKEMRKRRLKLSLRSYKRRKTRKSKL